ncbi:MAG: hypothetical protein L0Y50_00520 [Beijerinckiaceae bacterium]|nr:hypothetical protein [Beijerinckiaceae bacterium]
MYIRYEVRSLPIARQCEWDALPGHGVPGHFESSVPVNAIGAPLEL